MAAVPDAAPAADVAVIGAGAAGFFAAIHAAQAAQGRPVRIRLFDARRKYGAKILISGGTRCNLTNVSVRETDYHGGPRHVIRHVLEAYPPGAAVRLFESLGVEVVREPSGKLFPATHSGRTVLEALTREALRLGICIEEGRKIVSVEPSESGFLMTTVEEGRAASQTRVSARRVILATGGLSLPETGSDGTGLTIAEALGHRIIPTRPALTPLLTEDRDWRALSGLSLPVSLGLYLRGRKSVEVRGDFLFTHFGFSGPAALDISRHWASASDRDRPVLKADFLPDAEASALPRLWEAARRDHPLKSVKALLTENYRLPARLLETLMNRSGTDARALAGRLSRESALGLARSLRETELAVTGVYGYRKAEVTAGGVSLDEIRAATLESRRVPGLYFAGEILDVDGRIGGFNFQWAWSTGALAGRAAVRSLDAC